MPFWAQDAISLSNVFIVTERPPQIRHMPAWSIAWPVRAASMRQFVKFVQSIVAYRENLRKRDHMYLEHAALTSRRSKPSGGKRSNTAGSIDTL